jgi:(S)-ureidoglycine aminohydrolase
MKNIRLLCTTILTLLTGLIYAQQQDNFLSSRVYSWSSLPVKKEGSVLQRQVLKGRTTALSHFEINTTTLSAGQQPHFAKIFIDADELIIVKEGTLTLKLRDTMHTLDPGGIAFIMAGDLHGVENKTSTPVTYYVLKYSSGRPADTITSKKAGGTFALDWNQTVYKTTDKGGRRDFFNRPTSHVKKFEMHTTALRPGVDSHAPHTHPEEEIVLILKGKVEMHIAGKLYKAEPGDVVFLSSGVSHALINTGTDMCEYFAFQWRN